jgi:hypothetical protein
VPLQLEHIQSRARGGSDRVSNLCLACEPCNLAKGAQDVRAFLAHDPARLKRILAQARAPLKAATAVNATRWALYERLKGTGLPVEVGSGGRTKYNRAVRREVASVIVRHGKVKPGPNLLSHQQYPTRYGGKVTTCQKPSDNEPTAVRLTPEPRGQGVSASINAERGQGGKYGQHMRMLDKHRYV